jgi:transposase
MSKALSLDLRVRAVAAVREERLSHRAAAARFKVSAATISRWRTLERQSGDLQPAPSGGDRRCHSVI